MVGADDFVDSDAMVKNVFDTVTSDVREVAPTCRFSGIRSRFPISLTRRQTCRIRLVRMFSDDSSHCVPY